MKKEIRTQTFENRSNSRYTNFDSAKPVAERHKDLHAKISKQEVGNEMAAAHEPKTARGPARKQRAANTTMAEKMMPHNWDVRSTGWSHRQNQEDPQTKQSLQDHSQPPS